MYQRLAKAKAFELFSEGSASELEIQSRNLIIMVCFVYLYRVTGVLTEKIIDESVVEVISFNQVHITLDRLICCKNKCHIPLFSIDLYFVCLLQ